MRKIFNGDHERTITPTIGRTKFSNFAASNNAREYFAHDGSGIFSNNCLDILSNANPSLDDVYETYLDMLGYCSIPTFNASDSVWVLAEYYLIPIANGEIDPTEGLHKLMENVIWNYGFPNDQVYSRDSHGLEFLDGAYYGCDDLDPIHDASNKRWKDRSDMIVIYAKAWLKKYSPVLIKGE